MDNFFRISHRGPDSWRIQNVTSEDYVLAVHQVVKYGESTNCMQPLKLGGELDHLWLLFSGDIYNSQQIREEFDLTYETDLAGECLIRLYHKIGIREALRSVDGTFAFCLVDTAKEEVLVARDAMGVQSLYRATSESVLALCSEAKGLVKLQVEDSVELDVEQVPPGHYELYRVEERGAVVLQESSAFLELGEPPLYAPELEHITAEVKLYQREEIHTYFRELMTRSVRKKMKSSSKIGCLLSGGLSSSIVAGLLAQEAQGQGISEPVQTFTFGFEDSIDMMYAREVAEYIGSDHTEVIITEEDLVSVASKVVYHMEDADMDSIRDGIVMYTAMQYIKENTENMTVFTGDGLSQLRPGYRSAKDHVEADETCRLVLASMHERELLRTDKMPAAHGMKVTLPCVDLEVTAFYLSIKSEVRYSEEVRKKGGRTNRKKLLAAKQSKSNTTMKQTKIDSEEKSRKADGNPAKKTPSKPVRQTHTIKKNAVHKLDSTSEIQKKSTEKPKKKASGIKTVGLQSSESEVSMDLIQRAYYGHGLVPDEVLVRPRMSLSEGILPEGQTWEETFHAHFQKQVSFFESKRAYRKFPRKTPTTREAIFYRATFDTYFHGHEDLITTNE